VPSLTDFYYPAFCHIRLNVYAFKDDVLTVRSMGSDAHAAISRQKALWRILDKRVKKATACATPNAEWNDNGLASLRGVVLVEWRAAFHVPAAIKYRVRCLVSTVRIGVYAECDFIVTTGGEVLCAGIA